MASFGLLGQIKSSVRPALTGNQCFINFDINEGMSSRNVNVVEQVVDDVVCESEHPIVVGIHFCFLASHYQYPHS